jgi:hypothetical protein
MRHAVLLLAATFPIQQSYRNIGVIRFENIDAKDFR